MNDASTHSKGHIMQNELLTVREVAAYLRISRVTAWRWCHEGIIPAFRIGRSWRIRRDELLKLQETCDSDHHSENLEVR
jgi:PTS system nitrogen regulatory IIA component